MNVHRSILVGLVATASLTGAGVAGCATDGEKLFGPGETDIRIPTPDAGGDAADDGDAGPCTDCEHFPATCTADVLCMNELFVASGSFDQRKQVSTIRGRSATDVWLGGSLGTIAHYDGLAWQRLDIAAREPVRDFWLGGPAEVSLAALERQFGRDSGSSPVSWQARPAPTSPAEYGWWQRVLRSTWAAPGAAWLWGATEETRCQAPNCFNKPELRTSGLWRVKLTSPSEIQTGISAELCEAIACVSMASIHGASASTLWAVGQNGAALRITDPDAETPVVRALNTQTWVALHGVWAAGDNDVWAVGANGTVRHYTGDPVLWETVPGVPTNEDLRAVWGSSSSDVWAVGDGATVLHYDGKAWSRVKIAGLGARRPQLTAVWVASPGHVWIGGQGVVLSLGGVP